MIAISPAERRALRARAHKLKPVVFVGQHGLTPAVLHEIDIALTAHELIKVRVFSDARDEREALLERICNEMDTAPVQHLGKVLTLWRPAPEPEKAPKPAPRPKATRREPSRPRGGQPAPAAAGARTERRRAAPTAKGPFEPGRRTPRPDVGARQRRRRQP